jgi:hypothetical protein
MHSIILLFSSIEDVFSQSDMAKTLAEITKIDPSFNKDNFLHECEYDIIPTVLQVSAYSISTSHRHQARIYRKVPVFYLTIIGVYQQRLGTATGLVSRTGNVFNILLCFYYSTIYRQSLIRLICQHVRYKFDHGCNIKVPISWFWSLHISKV